MNGEFFWNKLLRYIDEGHVIPIVGPDLLRVKTGDGDRLFYPWLAGRVAHDLGLTEDIEWSFHEVASRTVARGGQLEDVYYAIAQAIPSRGVCDDLNLPTIDAV